MLKGAEADKKKIDALAEAEAIKAKALGYE